jgi:predicted MFS family arabinose efflux permease
MVLGPVFFKNTLGMGVKEYGLFLAAMGLGSLMGAYVIGKISHLLTPGRWFSLGTLSLGVVLMLLPFTRALVSASLISGMVGFFSQPVHIPSDSFLQGSPPEEVRGRVLSTMGILASVASLLGASLGGILADTFPILPAFLFCSTSYLGIGLISLFSKPMQEASV